MRAGHFHVGHITLTPPPRTLTLSSAGPRSGKTAVRRRSRALTGRAHTRLYVCSKSLDSLKFQTYSGFCGNELHFEAECTQEQKQLFKGMTHLLFHVRVISKCCGQGQR